MNQNKIQIKLRDLTARSDIHGNREGKEVYQKLLEIIQNHPESSLVEISLDGITRSDASFPRESVVSIARQFSGEKGVYLVGIDPEDNDLLDNWHYAALFKKQPLTVWFDDKYKTLGPTLTSSMTSVLEYVLLRNETTASDIAIQFDISIPNASSKLKKLAQDGYILRIEKVASSGGIEFVYSPIKK
ncbi:helix-turn-helix domain-containing protein [Pseudoalteromonas sp. JC3]|uniref:MarR family transcriptional regulator n=1 Tax=Pseudoalteromonas sp. JC3 TaxID=2810196 RepID=UPI0019D1CA38|nr:helix-turn-helix domain-containing protein [Pseudoalteromonas sp. JC3]MBR8842860.1 helix-turn-helix transcriptional regulator [Pseudoalteromonas sp. JC3]WJE09250.1 helix-turn-helix domain-containing protein [Pseudoalteromonas sp. JC3]